MERPAKIRRFRLWVFWTGIFNIVAYGPFICPFSLKMFFDVTNRLNAAFGLGGTSMALPTNVNNLMMLNILGLLIIFLGILLVLASLDIEKRAWFVFWEGLLRILVFVIFLYFVLFKGPAHLAILFGVIDLIIGIIYMYYIFTIEGLKIARP